MLSHDMIIGIWLGLASAGSVLYLKEHVEKLGEKKDKDKK